MKLQLTALAAAVSFSVSGAAMAAPGDITDLQTGLGNVQSESLTDSAGVTIDTEQQGDDNSATVTQENESTADSRVFQDSDNSSATVDQDGTDLYSDVDQQISEYGEAVVDQSGAGHRSRILQNGAYDSYAEVIQTGDTNTAFINQADVGGPAEQNNAYIEQNGDDNQSAIRQLSSNNIADSYQEGSLNESYIVQRAGSGLGHYAESAQYGTENYSEIDQGSLGTTTNHEAYLEQDGDYNKSYITQNGSTGNFIADVTQYSDNNYSEVVQTGVNDGTATVMQNGNGNFAYSYQY